MDILKRPQKFETISHLIWHLLSKYQIMWEIVLNFVAFLENLNFKKYHDTFCFYKASVKSHLRFTFMFSWGISIFIKKFKENSSVSNQIRLGCNCIVWVMIYFSAIKRIMYRTLGKKAIHILYRLGYYWHLFTRKSF